MDDRIIAFLKELEQKLTGLPDAEVKGALDYYEEYLNDALDEGKSIDELLENMDSPEKISTIIKTETSIRRAQDNPGLKNYSKVLKYAFSGITAPFSILLFTIFILITYGTALLLFCGAIVSAAAALVSLVGLFYEAYKIPFRFFPEILGTAGFGVFSSGIFLLTAYGLFLLCRLFIRLSSGLVGRMMNRSLKPIPETGEKRQTKGRSYRKLVRLCVTVTVVGMSISATSTLPVKMFNIFNSAKPASIKFNTWEFDKNDLKNIMISTQHSHIRLVKGSSDKITIKYEQPDWLEGSAECIQGKLTFTEKSNGRLPLFQLVALHESRTDVLIELPADVSISTLELESIGGFIYIEDFDHDIQVKTYSGSIFIGTNGQNVPSGIEASTTTGIIGFGDKPDVNEPTGLTYYKKPADNGRIIIAGTTRGSIFID
jgi:Predicted membrane protein